MSRMLTGALSGSETEKSICMPKIDAEVDKCE